MNQSKLILVWLFILFIGTPLLLSFCLYSNNKSLIVNVGEGFIRYYVVLTIIIIIFRIIAKLTNKGDKNE